jgi:hypothetical protein
MQQKKANPVCVPVPQAKRYARKAVRGMTFDGSTLMLDIQGEGFSYARLVFRDVIGFRVLDERDLGEFWNTYSEPNGWLWEVQSGGWLDLEETHPGRTFISHDMISDMREFFVVDDKCVSVLCRIAPELLDLGAAPPAA